MFDDEAGLIGGEARNGKQEQKKQVPHWQRPFFEARTLSATAVALHHTPDGDPGLLIENHTFLHAALRTALEIGILQVGDTMRV